MVDLIAHWLWTRDQSPLVRIENVLPPFGFILCILFIHV